MRPRIAPPSLQVVSEKQETTSARRAGHAPMGCGGSKGADASVELDDDVDPSVLEESLKQAAEAVQAAASAAEAARAGAQRASEAARAAAAAAALVAEAADPATAAAAAKAFQAAQEEQQSVMPPRARPPSPSDELSPRVRRPSTAKQESFGHRTHDEEASDDEFVDEPDTPDDSETEASDVESLDRVPVTPAVPSAPPPARNGSFKPRSSSPLAASVAAVPPVSIRDQVQRALARIHAPLKSPKALAMLHPCNAARAAVQAQSAELIAAWEAELRFTAEQEAAMAALRARMLEVRQLTPFWEP